MGLGGSDEEGEIAGANRGEFVRRDRPRSRSRERDARDRAGHRNAVRGDHRGYHDGRDHDRGGHPNRGRDSSRDRQGAQVRYSGGAPSSREWDDGKQKTQNRNDRDRTNDRHQPGRGGRGYRSDDRGGGFAGGRDGRDDRAPGYGAPPRRGGDDANGAPSSPSASARPAEPEPTHEETVAYQRRVEAAMEAMEEDDEDDEMKAQRVAEERRKRREEIMRKHASVKENARENENAVASVNEKPPPPVQTTKPVPAKPEPENKKNPAMPISDMFADTENFDDEAEERHAQRANRLSGKFAENANANGAVDMTAGLADNWDDQDGYYRARVGEVLDGRYKVLDTHGRGVFSTVVKASDESAVGPSADGPGPGGRSVDDGSAVPGGTFGDVAIKVIRANDTMYKAAQLEITILKKLMATDVGDTKHVVRFVRGFEFREHVFMVFESLHMNLREVLKKYGRDVGVNIKAVKSYTIQLLIALKHLEKCGVVHADIKPDNVLVNKNHNTLKLCDFGSAMFDGNNEITPYLQSRFYRAPEVILGLKYSFPLDMWSLGCCLFELYCGQMAFPGKSNNDMLRLFIETKGPLPRKLLRKAAFKELHYDDDGLFSQAVCDPVTKTEIRRTIRDSKPLRDIHQRVNQRARRDTNLTNEEKKMTTGLGDLLDKIFTFDPEKRITPSNALLHPFCQ